MTKDEARWYLAGIIDGEGCVYYKEGQKYNHNIQIGNTDWSIVETIKEALKTLNIYYTTHTYQRPNTVWRPCEMIQINRKLDLCRCLKEIPLQCMQKRDKLQKICSSYILTREMKELIGDLVQKSIVVDKRRRFTDKELEQIYTLCAQFSILEVSKRMKCHESCIRYYYTKLKESKTL